MFTLLIRMAFSMLPQIFISTLVLFVPLYFFITSKRSKNPLLPIDWPIVGMSYVLIANLQNFHDYITVVLDAAGHNFELRCPMVTGVSFFVTCDPENTRHIFTTNFANFPKGKEFADVFGLLDGTIFTTDGESWQRQRARIQHVLARPQLLAFMARCCRDKVAEGLIPLLTHRASTQTLFDMEELLGRLMFDMTVMVIFGTDPCHLSAGMPPMHVAVAMDTLMEFAFYRHSLPVTCWKVMKRLNIGWERKVSVAEAVVRKFVMEKIQTRIASHTRGRDDVTNVDILYHYINDPDYFNEDGKATDFLHRTFINYMVALRDPMCAALPWLVYSLATNQRALLNIRKELAAIAACKSTTALSGGTVIFEPEETIHLVYQRAAMFESLRLYPSGPIERKTALADDVLPSGHKVRGGETILISVYSMGRSEAIWGKDCQDFRPERWLTEDGSKLRYIPSYKFMAFNTGPRSCLGKNIALAQITSIVATMVWNFDIEVLERHKVKPKMSAVLQMKNGLMVKVKNRQGSNV